MQVIEILAIVIVSVAVLIAIQFIIKKLNSWQAARQENAKALNETLTQLAKTLEVVVKSQIVFEQALVPEVGKLQKALLDSNAMTEKMLTGATKACEAIAVSTEKHRMTVEQLGKLLFDGGSKDALQVAQEEDRDRHYAEIAYRIAGKTPEEAKMLAEEELAGESTMYPSS